MPRDLGKAERKDLLGKLPGEDEEFVSGIVRFLEGAGQLAPPGNGAYGGNGNGRNRHDTEVPRRAGGNGSSKTESLRADPHDTVFDEPLTIEDMQNEPLLSPEPLLEPQALDQPAPDASLINELYSAREDDVPAHEKFDLDDETDTAPPRRRRGMPTLKPEPHELPPSQDTGVLEMDVARLDDDDRLSTQDLDSEDESEIAGGEDSRATEKLHPRSDRDPRWRPSGPTVRDTVNFYNQTQNLGSTRGPANPIKPHNPGKVPSISPSEISARHPMDLNPDDELTAEPVTARLPAIDDDEIGRDTDKYFGGKPPDADARKQADQPAPKSKADAAERPKSSPSDSTAGDLQLADIGPPPGRSLGSPSDTAGDFSSALRAERDPEHAPTRKAPRTRKPEPLPNPEQVRGDFKRAPAGKPSERIVPELRAADSAELDSSFLDKEPEDSANETPERTGRITEKVGKSRQEHIPGMKDASLPETAPLPPRPQINTSTSRVEEEAGVQRVTDALARRIREEREETLRLIQQAEEVASRLRSASEHSRRSLATLSGLPPAVPSGETTMREPAPQAAAPHLEAPPPAPAETSERPTARQSVRGEFDTSLLPSPTQPLKDEPRASDTLRTDPVPPPPPQAESRRTTRRRVPTQDIGELVGRIEQKLGGKTASLEDIIREASKRMESADEPEPVLPDVPMDDYASMDLDQLVAASSALRESVEAEWDEDQHSGITPEASDPRPTERLSGALEAIWEEVDSRSATGVIEERKVRIAQTGDEVGLGWTQEALWKTYVGIGGVVFGLGALFAYVVYSIFSY
jgi:hypothetical protein